MYKVCFNEKDQIIGFNISNCIRYINLFNIEDVTKEIFEDKTIEQLDSYGRNVFIKKHKETGNCVFVSSMENDDFFEDELFEYEKQYKIVKQKKVVSLLNECNLFTLEDIIDIKKNQLINKYQCSDCQLYETFEDMQGSKYIRGKNFIRINNTSELLLNKLKHKKNSEMQIYYETDKNIDIFLNNKKANCENIYKITTEKIKLEFKGEQESNIYCIAVLFK